MNTDEHSTENYMSGEKTYWSIGGIGMKEGKKERKQSERENQYKIIIYQKERKKVDQSKRKNTQGN